MTFCLGMRVHEGLVGLSDTRVTSGNEVIQARKVSVYHPEGGRMFLMTSGLGSVRDKALAYFDELLAEREEPFDRLFKAVNAFATQLRRVAKEDRAALKEGGLNFDIHCIVGGQMRNDSTRISAADVDFPLDVILYRRDTFQLVEHRYDRSELGHISDWWDEHLRKLIHTLPSEWIEAVMAKLQPT